MKTRIFLLTLLLGSAAVKAQDNNFTFNSGGFGHFYTGVSYLGIPQLRDYLEKPAVLNVSLPSRPGVISGGEGAGLLGRFILGGGGFGETALRQTFDSARVNISSGAGYFKFGYVCCTHKNSFGYLYGGIGWGGLNVHLENLTEERSFNFNHRSPLQPGFKTDYHLPYNLYEVGFSMKTLFSGNETGADRGGFMLGFDAGCLVLIPHGDWESDRDEVISGPPVSAGMFSPYVRLTIGGGGFSAN